MAKSKSKHKSKTLSGPKIKRWRVPFSFEADGAREVILIGDFNNWDPQKHAMKHDGQGTWNKTVVIAPGRYEYKFVVDGDWRTDPNNSQACSNCYGTHNSVLEIDEG